MMIQGITTMLVKARSDRAAPRHSPSMPSRDVARWLDASHKLRRQPVQLLAARCCALGRKNRHRHQLPPSTSSTVARSCPNTAMSTGRGQAPRPRPHTEQVTFAEASEGRSVRSHHISPLKRGQQIHAPPPGLNCLSPDHLSEGRVRAERRDPPQEVRPAPALALRPPYRARATGRASATTSGAL